MRCVESGVDCAESSERYVETRTRRALFVTSLFLAIASSTRPFFSRQFCPLIRQVVGLPGLRQFYGRPCRTGQSKIGEITS